MKQYFQDDSHYFMVQLHSECGCKVRRRNIIYFLVGDRDDNDRDTIYNCQNTHAAKIIPSKTIIDFSGRKNYAGAIFLLFFF